MRWFGKARFARACRPDMQVACPTGANCVQCGKPIGPDDQGLIMPFVGGPTGEAVYHHACFMRSLGIDPPDGYGARSNRPVIRVCHAKLTLDDPEASRFRAVCPVCDGGTLLGRRNPETFQLLRTDNCIRCGQRFEYTDVEIAGWPLPGIGEG